MYFNLDKIDIEPFIIGVGGGLLVGRLFFNKKQVFQAMETSYAGRDKFGISKIYPTALGGKEWYSNWSQSRILKTNTFDPLDPSFGVTCGTGAGQGLYIGGGKATWNADSSPRMYVHGPWKNTEQTVYARVRGSVSSIQLRSRANHHGAKDLPYPDMGVDPATGKKEFSCGFGNYLVKWGETGLNFVSVELEIIHGMYKRHLIDKPLVIPKNQFVGFKTVTKNIPGGKIKVQGWNNLTGNHVTGWKKVIEYIFDGTNAALDSQESAQDQARIAYCKDKGDKIAGDLNAHQIWTKSSYWNWLRTNNAKDVDYKYYSIREI